MLKELTTERRNPNSMGIDKMNSREILTVINEEDKKVPLAVEKALDNLAPLVDDTVTSLKNGGSLFYIGAGTSGRLGVLDASECPPTYSAPPEMVQGIIAGGQKALTISVEGAEDDGDAGVLALKERNFTSKDVLVGITASGQAPFVVDAMIYAQSIGAKVGAVSCNPTSTTFNHADHKILAHVGPEVVTGSTRMKSGTAQKLILNMLTTATMVRLGKVYQNLMVDMRPVNKKLVQRSKNLIMEITGCSEDEATEAFEASNHQPKVAIVIQLLGISKEEAESLLAKNEGSIAYAVDQKK